MADVKNVFGILWYYFTKRRSDRSNRSVIRKKNQLLFFSLCYYETSKVASHPGNFGGDKQTSIEDCLAVPKM